MNKGKELLIDIITSYQDKLSDMADNRIMVCGKDIVEISNNIKENKYYLGNLTDDLIDEIIKMNKYRSHFIFIKKLYQLRDLYLGKLEYNINIEEKEDYTKTLTTFITLLDNIINQDNEVVQKEELNTRMNIMLGAIKYNEIINDDELIELMARDYDITNYDKNMLDIMEYVSKHNVNILNENTLEDTINLTNELKISEIDPEVKDILNKFEINYNELSIEYKLAIKNTPVEFIKNTYELIRHNKVEDYGILHLIDRNNELIKLMILLYSKEEAISSIVELFRDNNNDLDVKTIKNVINMITPAFICRDNEFFKPMYLEFMANANTFKDVGIDLATLINKCPLIFIMDNVKLNNTLGLFNKYNVDSKKVINKLYKTIATNSELIFENIEVLKKYIDIEKYLENDNYTLLKVVDLDKKIDYVINKYQVSSSSDIIKCITKEVYENSDKNVWGDIDA